MPEIKVCRDCFGKRIIKISNYEISRNEDGVKIVRHESFGRYTVYDRIFGEKAPIFPNFMQAARFVKENWETIY